MGVATTKEELEKAIRTAILESGLSVREIEEQAGVSKTHIHALTQSGDRKAWSLSKSENGLKN